MSLFVNSVSEWIKPSVFTGYQSSQKSVCVEILCTTGVSGWTKPIDCKSVQGVRVAKKCVYTIYSVRVEILCTQGVTVEKAKSVLGMSE